MRATADFVTPDANMALIFNISSFTLTTFPVCPGGLPNCMPAFFLAASASFVLCEIRFLSISAASANANAIIFELMLSVRLKLSLMVRKNTPFWEHAFSTDIIMSMLRPKREISVHTSMSALQALQSARHAGLTEATEANIKNEWYRETVGEGLRMSCLKRWGEGFDGRAAQTGAEDVIQGLGTEYYDLRSIAATDHVFQWPIPAYEIQTNLNLVQNEGYGNASAE